MSSQPLGSIRSIKMKPSEGFPVERLKSLSGSRQALGSIRFLKLKPHEGFPAEQLP